MIVQRLVLADGLWSCPGCGAKLGDNDQSFPALEHKDDCPEIGGPEEPYCEGCGGPHRPLRIRIV